MPNAQAEVTVESAEAAPTPRYVLPAADYFAAAASGDIDTLQRCLDEGRGRGLAGAAAAAGFSADGVSAQVPGGLLLRDPGATALMLATAAGKTDTMQFLIKAKANCEARTRSDIRPLDIAAERNDLSAMQMLIGVTPTSDAARLAIDVNLATQLATVTRDGQTLLTTKVSSGKPDKPTPPGKYIVTHKYTEWHSTLYHNAKMPFFLRLSCSAVGLHAGVLPGYPASHGCVRLPSVTWRRSCSRSSRAARRW